MTPDSGKPPPSGRQSWPRTGVCVLTIRPKGDQLVYRALYGLNVDPVSPTNEFQTLEFDEIVALLRMLSDSVRNPG